MIAFTAKSIYRQLFKNKFPERNENFLPGRMAYIIELDDDYAESDIPTTLMRSKTDCPNMEVMVCNENVSLRLFLH